MNRRIWRMGLRLNVLFCFLSGALVQAEVPIVYSRCPRSNQPFSISGPVTKTGVTTTQTTTITNGDLLDGLPDTGRIVSNFAAPCDLIYRDANGQEKTLYSCIAEATETRGCAALDASVSFDGTTVAFTVFRGRLARVRASANGKVFDPLAENTANFAVDVPSRYLADDASNESQIVLIDVATGTLTPIASPPKTHNFGPTWLSNGRLAFTSNRKSIYGPMPIICSNNSALAKQLYTVDPDGRNIELVSPHAAAAELHPIQLSDGRVAVSSWQTFGQLIHRHGNSQFGCGTGANFFHIYAQNPDGSNATAIYGQHLSDAHSYEMLTLKLGGKLATHFFGQTTDGRVWTAEYYRANNLGLGAIEGFPVPPPGQEGPNVGEATTLKMSPFRAWNNVNLATWANRGDNYALPMPAPEFRHPSYSDPIKYAGKIGHPSGLPGNQLMLTWGMGPCSQVSGRLGAVAMQELAADAGDNPGCDTGIYRTNGLPSITTPGPYVNHPSDLVEIVNRPEYHEFMARPVVAYSEIYGISAPPVIERSELQGDTALEEGTPFGIVGASSILHRETNPPGPLTYNKGPAGALVGTDMVNYRDDELCGIRVLVTYPNRKVESAWKSANVVGERVAILGEFPVRNFDEQGAPLVDGLGMPDTSFKVKIPADTPYLLQGIDCEGRTLNTDQTWQSVRPGEVKTCNGCHVHSTAATKLPFAQSPAAQGKTKVATLGAGQIPLLTGGSGTLVKSQNKPGYTYMIEYSRDIEPIFNRRCVSCHAGATPAAGLSLDIPETSKNAEYAAAATNTSTYFRLIFDLMQKYVPSTNRYYSDVGANHEGLRKPNLSKYVRMMNSRGSLLYWKAKNGRSDGFTDADRPDDVDFGADHPTGMTDEELGILSRWIDTGAGWGPDFEQDTVTPALHVVGIEEQGALKALKIGTADVGSGIKSDSLTVCVLSAAASDACGPNLAPPANAAGVVSVNFAEPLTDLDTELLIRVGDLSGNVTEVRRTVRFLLSIPPPSVVMPDAGEPAPDAGTESNSGASADGGAEGNTIPDVENFGPVKGRCSCDGATSLLAGLALLVLRAARRQNSAAPRHF